jgi:ribosomal 50S subunit-associated protein YjgA (DUF615 family)
MPRHDSAPPDDRDLTSRTDVKRANRVVEETLARLSTSLFELGPRRVAALELPDTVLEAVMEAFAMKNVRARQRQLGLVRVALRGADWGAIQGRVRRLVEGQPLGDAAGEAERARDAEEATWLARLLGEGFAGLDAFLAAFPRADRARLLDLIHQVDRSSHERRVKAERKLADTIRSFLTSGERASTAT